MLTEDFALTGSRAWPGGALALVGVGKQAVGEIVEQVGADSVVVTGHSLGAALANIVGTHLHVTSFGVSPPGSEFGRHLYNFTSIQIAKYVHALVPQRDPVTTLGTMQGNVAHLPCLEPSALNCHTLDVTICMLAAICNDPHLSNTCQPLWSSWASVSSDF